MATSTEPERIPVPRSREDDYTHEAARARRDFARMFPSAREARDFGEWLTESFDEIKQVGESTTRCGELSLGSAIVAEEWVHAHDLHGRNRP